MSGNTFRQELLAQARELVFSSGSDAAALAFRGAGGDGQETELKGLDLTAVSSIHRMANGSVELKFIDRIKLIELLLAAGDDRARRGEGDGFIQALDRAAQRLGGGGTASAGSAEGQDGADAFAAGELDLERERSAGGFGEGPGGAGDGGGGGEDGGGRGR